MGDSPCITYMALYILTFHILQTNSRTSSFWKLNVEDGKIIEVNHFPSLVSSVFPNDNVDDPIFNIITSTVHYGKSWTKGSAENYCTDCQSINSTTQRSDPYESEENKTVQRSDSEIDDEVLDCGKTVNFTYYDNLVGIANRMNHPNVPEPQVALIFKKRNAELDIEGLERRLKKAKREKPKSVQLYNQIGNFFRIKGDTTKSIECFRRALAVSPHNAEVLLNLARVMFNLQYLDDAIYLTRRSLEVQPPDKSAWQQYFTLGEIFKAYGHYQEATLHLRHCLELRPEFEPALATLRDMEALPDNNIHIYTVLIIIFLKRMEGRHCPPPPRRPYLRFPPPPPFPPADYAYAYYEPGTSSGKHNFITRYGTEENIYEEIGASQLEEEVRYVHSRHLQVLDELNLTMEAMLMPDGGPGPELSAADEMLSPATCSMDSGFSGSSTGTNSLGRQPPSTPRTKKAPPFWKKLSGLHHSVSPSPSKSVEEARCVSSSWDESSRDQSQRGSGSESDLSSGDESNKSVDGRQGSKSRSLWRRNSASPDPPPPPGRLSRWFSIRRGSQYDLENKERGKMPLLPEVEEEGGLCHRRLLPPTLPPPPPHLSPQELKRRHIVAAIVHSENSYLATLHRLVNDYKKPLEEASPAILSASKISILFHRLPEILQCHTLFRIALAEAVTNWDRDHRIGDVFVASFSKGIVLDIYSGFINNFSVAMELARSETKRKAALTEFFRARQVSSLDRLSFFGLMVKPVQRFPQFILFLQDLLHHTGHGHPDRMSLQLALTQLESLAELLNERKRESEQSQAFREMLRAISGKLSIKNTSDNNRCLLRQDDVTHMDINQCGLINQYKSRRLLLLNDLLICVSVSNKQDAINSGPQRLNLKWSSPISDVQVVENSTSPILSRLLTPNGSLSPNGVTENLCSEMSRLMQDYQVVSRIAELASKLHGSYPELSMDVTRGLLNSIQCEIQHKDDQMAWVDSCCLQLSLRNKDDNLIFQMESPEARNEWITELRLARLALDPANSPAWEVPDQEPRPTTKMPLFVAAHPVYTSQQQSEVVCGCYYTAACGKSYLWVCTTDGTQSHISVAQSLQTTLKPLTQLTLPDVRVSAMEYVRGAEAVWIGTHSQQMLVYSVVEVERPERTHSLTLTGGVVVIKQHCDSVFVAMTTGSLLVFRRHQLTEPEEIVLGSEPVSCLLPINLSLYAACGKTITVLRAITAEIQKSCTIQHEHVGGNVHLMATSGVGLWLSLSNSSTICLYHTETFKHLQDINVASNVVRLTGNPGPVAVTALLACKGLLWVGTDAGVSLTVPLPRLEGVPIISGRVSVSYHAHVGPTRLLLPLQDPPTVLKRPPSKALACDIYGLYGQLMYVKDYDETDERLDTSHWSLSTSSEEGGAPDRRRQRRGSEHTLVTVTGGRGYTNLQQPCCTTITDNAHVLLWEMKL